MKSCAVYRGGRAAAAGYGYLPTGESTSCCRCRCHDNVTVQNGPMPKFLPAVAAGRPTAKTMTFAALPMTDLRAIVCFEWCPKNCSFDSNDINRKRHARFANKQFKQNYLMVAHSYQER
jgi:hypothetical protein